MPIPRVDLLLFASLLIAGCAPAPPDPVREPPVDTAAPSAGDTASPEVTPPRTPAEYPGLRNVLRVSERIFSGSEPQGTAGFKSLEQLGIRTIVSVDGARPDVEQARTQGLRYIHIPIGYDGVPPAACQALTHALRETEGLVYIHCHRGKHRGPAAAAIAAQAAGELAATAATQILRDAGTSPDYPGLWRDVAHFELPPADAELPALVEVAEVPSLVTAMADLDRHFEQLKRSGKSGWRPPAAATAKLPAMTTPSAAAALLQDGFLEIRRTVDLSAYPADFLTLLTEADAAAAGLREQLDPLDPAQADQALEQVETACQHCHARHRDGDTGK